MHFFDPQIAVKYGVNAAILLQNIAYWCEHNEANEKNYNDGLYWTYNSTKAFRELFPYMSDWQVRKAISALVDDGLIVTGNYNQSTYDRTLWYAITEKGKSILPVVKMDTKKTTTSIYKKPRMEIEKTANGDIKNHEPIPNNNNTNINTNIKPIDNTDEPKHKYGEYCKVLLTDKELQKLYTDFGQDKTEKAISYLDMYIKEKGYKSKSHYLAMRRWVFNAVNERQKKKPVSGYDWDNL